jgi:acetyl-CoA C-acetyltransferase
MLKEIHLAGSVRTPFGSFCDAFADVSAVELGKAAVERSGVKPEEVKELLVGNILSDALRPNVARQIGIGMGLRRRRNGNRDGP